MQHSISILTNSRILYLIWKLPITLKFWQGPRSIYVQQTLKRLIYLRLKYQTMTSSQLQEQKIKAKALLRRAEQEFKKGLISAHELEKVKKHGIALADYNPELAAAEQVEPDADLQNGKLLDPSTLPAEVIQALERVKSEQNSIHLQKAKLCNSLVAIPDDINCKDMVTEILQLREAWKKKGDEVYAIMSTGLLPEAEQMFDKDGYRKTLPQDTEKLRLRIQNTQSNIRKAQKRLEGSKTSLNKRQNELKIARWAAEIEQMRMQLAAL